MATVTVPVRSSALSSFMRVGLAASGAYVGASVIANVASLKIGFVLGRGVDMGTFVYPITFTLRDVIHKALGKRAARTIVFTGAGVNVFMALYLQFAARVPADMSYPLGAEFSAVLSPAWRITVASIVAQVISELTDTEVYHWFVTKVTAGHQWARVVVSNGISLPIDTALFCVLAFGAIPGLRQNALTLPWAVVWDIFVMNLGVKALVTLASVPLIYLSGDRDWSTDKEDA